MFLAYDMKQRNVNLLDLKLFLSPSSLTFSLSLSLYSLYLSLSLLTRLQNLRTFQDGANAMFAPHRENVKCSKGPGPH